MGERMHTGRRRNEAARSAVLHAAAELLAAGDGATITVAAIANRAAVGRQTIYRWWPSKGAILLEAITRYSQVVVPIPNTGDLQADLRAFLRTTFATASASRTLLLGTLHEALGDDQTSTQLAGF